MQLHEPTKLGSHGLAVEGDKRGVYRLLGDGRLATLRTRPEHVRQHFGPDFQTLVKQAQKMLDIPATGIVGVHTQDALYAGGWYDLRALDLFGALRPVLIEPYQGWNSLHKSLWEAYSVGVGEYGLVDGPWKGKPTASGTYANKPGDHGYWPSWAFDLDVDPDGPVGWDSPKAQAYFRKCIEKHLEWNIEYVILGPKIWSRSRGLHAYTSGGHFNHVHVSGHH